MARRTWFIVLSILGHATIGAGVYIAGTWKIERLDRDRRPLATLAVLMPPPAASGGGLQLPAAQITPKERPRRVVRDLVQPIATRTVEPADSASTNATGGGGGVGSGQGPGTDPDGDPDGTCLVPPCGHGPAAPAPPLPPLPEPPTDRYVTPGEFTRLRITGDTQIHPPPAIKHRMRGDGRGAVVGVIDVCVAATGHVARTRVLRSTGYPEYDAKLLEGVRGWRYRATPGGTRVNICSPVTFQYRMTER
jgi:TonB family protein